MTLRQRMVFYIVAYSITFTVVGTFVIGTLWLFASWIGGAVARLPR